MAAELMAHCLFSPDGHPSLFLPGPIANQPNNPLLPLLADGEKDHLLALFRSLGPQKGFPFQSRVVVASGCEFEGAFFLNPVSGNRTMA